MRQLVDLSAHLNLNVAKGGPADFPVSLKPLHYRENGSFTEVPRRLAVVRQDNGVPLAVVSDRYSIVPHRKVLDIAERASQSLDVGPVPRGVYVDRQGARMRAIFKYPTLAQPVLGRDEICPCLMIQNTYDGTSRIAIQIGAFRFVCTNLAVGGGGVFAGGFMAVQTFTRVSASTLRPGDVVEVTFSPYAILPPSTVVATSLSDQWEPLF
jgi:hypothetical protein